MAENAPEKKEGGENAKSPRAAEVTPGADRGRGGRGGPGGGGDRGRFTPRGRGGPPAVRGGPPSNRGGPNTPRGGGGSHTPRGGGPTPPRGSFTPRGFDGSRGRGMPGRGGRGGRGGFDGHAGNGNSSFGDDELMHQLMEEAEAEKSKEPKKFLGRCRLFVGNLPNDMKETEFEELFKPYGETSEVFLNQQRGFGFVRLDFLHNAQHAKSKLDGTDVKGRVIRVRFASHGAALKIKYLSTFISNELLEQAFSQFGPVERAVVYVDERGKSLGEGIVEFARKSSAQMALRRINEGVMLMSTQPRPILVESIEVRDEEDGLPEKSVPKNPMYMKERDHPPRFAMPNTFEFDFAQRWKQLYELEKQQRDQLEVQIKEARERLQDEESFAIQEWHAQQLRQELEQRQAELKRMEERQAAERARREEEHKRRLEEQMRYREEETRRHDEMMRRDDEIRQRQNDRIRGRPGGEGGGRPGEDMGGNTGGGGPGGEMGGWNRGNAPDQKTEEKEEQADGETKERPLPPADIIKRNFQFEERGGFPGRGFPRGISGRRGPDFREPSDFKRPRWN